jgi:GntR family transcriptional regulator
MTAEVDITCSLYTQVETALASDIAAATVPSGKSITLGRQPNRSVRCQSDYVTKRDRNLVARGLVEIRRGKRTFVTQPKMKQDLTN